MEDPKSKGDEEEKTTETGRRENGDHISRVLRSVETAVPLLWD